MSLQLRFDCQNARFVENKVFGSVHFDFGAAVFGIDDEVADFHVEFDFLTGIKRAARADSDDGALLGALFGRIGERDAARSHFARFGGLDENFVAQWFDVGHFRLVVPLGNGC